MSMRNCAQFVFLLLAFAAHEILCEPSFAQPSVAPFGARSGSAGPKPAALPVAKPPIGMPPPPRAASPAPTASLAASSFGGQVFPIEPDPGVFNISVANTITDWNIAIQWVARESNSSLIANRVFALTHLAIWRALEANRKAGNPAEKYAVAAYAAHLALMNSYPFYYFRFNRLLRLQTKGMSDERRNATLKIVVPCVLVLLGDRLDDGTQQWLDYEPPNSTEYGAFRILLPPEGFQRRTATLPQGVPQLATSKPFVLPAPIDQVDFVRDIPPPLPIPSDEYDLEYDLVKELGARNSTMRSMNESNLAYMWADSYTDTAGLSAQWMRVALATLPKTVNLRQTGELLAALACAQFDANVAVYNQKYRWNYWRPITGIQSGDPHNEPDPTWESYLLSQNNPSYPSKLGALSGVGLVILSSYYKKWNHTDLSFSLRSDLVLPFPDVLPVRRYSSLEQAAYEATQSRVFSGQEFLFSAVVGQKLGEQVAQYILDNIKQL